MSLAETAILAVELQLGTKGSFKGATSEISAVEGAASRGTRGISGLSGGFGRASGAAKGFGGALSSAGGHLKELVTGPLGIIGLSGGLFALGGIFESSIHHASDMGLAVEKLTGLTGESATAMSGLVAVFERFGISNDKTAQIVGFTEKALGKLTASGTAAIDFQKRYGVAILDTSGKALPFTAILNNLADYYNSSASASDKAAAASKLLGRGYAQLIPVLKLGSAGIKEAEQAAADLGLTLTAQNASDLKNYRGALRDVGEAIGGLQLQIGLALLPEVAKLARGFTDFLSHGGTQKIVGFFKDAAHFAEELGSVFTTSVLPTLQGLGSAASAAWGAIPPEFRDLLVKGFIADRTVKFLFGISPIKLAVDFAEGALSKVGGSIAAGLVSKAFVQPVFVTNPGFGLPGAAAGAGEAAIGGEVVAGAAGLSVGTIALGLVAGTAVAAIGLMGLGWLINATSSQAEQQAAINNAIEENRRKHGGGVAPAGAGPGKQADDITSPNNPMNLRLGKIADDLVLARGATLSAAVKTVHVLDAIHLQLVNANHTLKTSNDPAAIAKAAIAAANAITKGVGSVGTTQDTIANLKHALANTHDPKLQASLRDAIHKVEAKVAGREYAAKLNAEVGKMLADGRVSNSELARIKTIQADLLHHGLPSAAKKIEAKVEAAQRAQVAAQKVTTEAVRDKKLSVAVTNVINTLVRVSARETSKVQTTQKRFGLVLS